MKKTKKLKMVLIGLTCLMTAGMQMDVFAGETVPTVKTVHKHFVMAEGIASSTRSTNILFSSDSTASCFFMLSGSSESNSTPDTMYFNSEYGFSGKSGE